MAGIWWDSWREGRRDKKDSGRTIPATRTASAKAPRCEKSDLFKRACLELSAAGKQRGEMGQERAVDTSFEGS